MILKINFVDIFILVSVIMLLSLIIYYNFIKKDKNSCCGCPVVKKTSRTNKNIKKQFNKQK